MSFNIFVRQQYWHQLFLIHSLIYVCDDFILLISMEVTNCHCCHNFMSIRLGRTLTLPLESCIWSSSKVTKYVPLGHLFVGCYSRGEIFGSIARYVIFRGSVIDVPSGQTLSPLLWYRLHSYRQETNSADIILHLTYKVQYTIFSLGYWVSKIHVQTH